MEITEARVTNLLILGYTFFFLSGNFQDGKRVSLSVYLGEFFDIHLFVNGTVMQGDQR